MATRLSDDICRCMPAHLGCERRNQCARYLSACGDWTPIADFTAGRDKAEPCELFIDAREREQ